MIDDTAVVQAKNDKLDRGDLVSALASALHLPPGAASMVTALEGEWGSGKTSILNLVEERLKDSQKDVIVVRFNPWLISGFEALCESLLLHLAISISHIPLGQQSADAARKTLAFARLLSPIKLIPGVEPFGSIIEGVLTSAGTATEAAAELSKLDLEGQKKDLCKAIKELDKSIVVMIDDIDRLTRDEIRTVFRLVKAVADFPSVAYLLAYDPPQVHRALSETGKEENGRSYLEKIVQLQYPVPYMSYWKLKQSLTDAINELIKANTIKLEDFESTRLTEVLSSGVTHMVKNMRDVSRLMSKLRISATLTKGEVNFGDLVAYETLSLKYPQVATVIQQHPYEFVSATSKLYFSNDYLHGEHFNPWSDLSSGQGESAESAAYKLIPWESIKDEQKKTIFTLLGILFPNFDKNGQHEKPKNPESKLMICAQAPMIRLLSATSVIGFHTAHDIRQFLENENEREEYLGYLNENNILESWWRDCAYHATAIDIPEEEKLIELAAASCVNTGNIITREILDELAEFLHSLLSKSDIDDLITKLKLIAKNQYSASFGVRLMTNIAADSGILNWRKSYPDDQLLPDSPTEATMIINLWLESVKSKSSDIDSFSREPALLLILYRWGQFSHDDYSEVHLFTKKWLSTDDGLLQFSHLFKENIGVDGVENLIQEPIAIAERLIELKKSTLDSSIPDKLIGRLQMAAVSETQKDSG